MAGALWQAVRLTPKSNRAVKVMRREVCMAELYYEWSAAQGEQIVWGAKSIAKGGTKRCG